ncbi:light-sensor Protein kinase-like [Heracleum sosnowskyi]|uniref:Light-sensor Protein kinase-like n=1 Tax=Heracleum sosnowskyi TaxID=360622 RepID=A0AAD8I126_9APIA|nr:light-sensor Protein kinase-like [Heracleum sosnowskyi]
MEQFRQIGEVVGSLKAMMVFREEIQINQRQCCLLLDMFSFAYETIAEEMKQHLIYEEKNTKWKVLEPPLKELHRVLKEGELYIRQCLDTRNWWAKTITLYQNKDCVEFHMHNLLCCIPVVIEAIEVAGDMSGCDQDEKKKKRVLYSMKYQKQNKDPKIFQWKFGKQNLVTKDFCSRLETVWDEDRWILLRKILEKRKLNSENSTKRIKRLEELLFKNLNDGVEALDGKLLRSSILVGSKDYQVRRRIGSGSQYKEIQWLGESFCLRHFFGDIEPMIPEISQELSLSHPHIMHTFCGFTDEEKKECFLVMELMTRDLSSYMKEISGPKKRVPFSLPAAVDVMLQIARGMEYLHSKQIYHGNLNPSNILVKARNPIVDGYLHAKVSGFGLSSSISLVQKSSTTQDESHPSIWYPPEVLEEQDQAGEMKSKYTEKSDVYSFGMVCFQLLTGKVPFEDSHLQGDKVSHNIRTGERPLFPFQSPKYVMSLTKRCWHSDPTQRPSFSSICRILRYIKRFLLMNPDHSQPEAPMPVVDYTEIDAKLRKEYAYWESSDLLPVSDLPFQIFSYRIVEKEKSILSQRETSESESDVTSAYGDDNLMLDEPFSPATERKTVIYPDALSPRPKRLSSLKKIPDLKTSNGPGTPRSRSVRPPKTTLTGRALRMSSENQLPVRSPRPRRTSGHVSDSELC